MFKKIIVLSILTVIITGCSNIKVSEMSKEGATVELEPEKSQTSYPIEMATQTPSEGYPIGSEMGELGLRETAEQVITALSEKNMVKVAEFVQPGWGLRFSPYATIREDHQLFMPGELPELVESDQVYTWGAYDGSGGPIKMTFNEYYQEFVYSADFANPEQMAVNERLGQGNSINNIGEFFPGSSFVEYYFSGFEEQYEGMDWQSLRLVFMQEDGAWWLVGIIDDEWTI